MCTAMAIRIAFDEKDEVPDRLSGTSLQTSFSDLLCSNFWKHPTCEAYLTLSPVHVFEALSRLSDVYLWESCCSDYHTDFFVACVGHIEGTQ